ncbi:transglutaminase domain-containing protein [Pseudotenacibaculum sp. MALMAid0570]|uniref:transglutaminase domain-containing protein n=1 Tax=Pseudotenacibaculum sp. MALMAid0570 TaxID=3143938 RepID=UPI0032DEEC95
MKRLFLLFFLISSVAFSQDFSAIDNKVKTYPRYTSPEKLAAKISNDFKDDMSKVRAAFRWLTLNIRYNLEEYYQPRKVIQFSYSTEEERQRKLQGIKDKIIKDAFLTKMGVCEEYAQSFKKLADLMGIEAQVIKGYVRNSAYEIGRIPRSTNHAWNSVKINNRWILLDATWAAGYVFNGKWVKDFNEYYFGIDPKKVSRTHYPDDKKWQIVLNYNSLEDFYNQPIYSQGFLRKDIQLLSPKKGTIVVDKSKNVVITFQNLTSADQLFYNYQGQRYSKRPQISYEGKKATVSIENPGRDSELYLFLNRNLALEYKVSIK